MYRQFFGLQEKPFGLTPDPAFLFLSEQHQEALDHLLYGIREKEGFVLISGDTGTGKTTLCRALLQRLDAGQVTAALLVNPLLAEEELLRAILEEFGLEARGDTRKDLLDELHTFLVEATAADKTVVLIIDEAQKLSADCLEQVRLLSNLETAKEKLIQIILVGTRELPTRLELPELRHLKQRISVRYCLKPLSRKDTRSYIQHRLAMAGAAGGITFEKKAYREIYRYSGGIPRLINMIADRSLLAACLEDSRTVKRSQVIRGRESLRGTVPAGYGIGHLCLHRKFHPALLAVFFLVLMAAMLMVPEVREALERQYAHRLSTAPVHQADGSKSYLRLSIRGGEQVRGAPAGAGTAGQGQELPGDRSSEHRRAGAEATSLEGKTQSGAEGAGVTVKEPGPVRAEPAPGALEAAESVNKVPRYVFKPPYIYTVHVNSYRNREAALARRRELEMRDFNAWVAWVDLDAKGIWYRVLLGSYEDKGEALALTRRLNQREEFHDARQIAVYAGISPQPSGAVQ
jgi:type II secretory pathway predicted ATPase ExeA